MTETGGAAAFVGRLQLLLQILQGFAGLLEGAAAAGRRVTQGGDLVFERDLIARQVLRQAADLLGDERTDAEDQRKREHDDEDDRRAVGKAAAFQQPHSRGEHERQDDGQCQRHEDDLSEVQPDDDDEADDRHFGGGRRDARHGQAGGRRGGVHLGVGDVHARAPLVGGLRPSPASIQRLRRRAAPKPNRNAVPTTCIAPK